MHISIERIFADEKQAEAIASATKKHLARRGVSCALCRAVGRDGRLVVAIHHEARPTKALLALFREAAVAASIQAARHQPLVAA